MSCLSRKLLEFLFDLLTAGLGIARSGSNRWGPLARDMAQIDGNLLQGPSRSASAMRKIVAQIVVGNICDQFPLGMGGFRFERSPPGMDAFLGQPPGIVIRWHVHPRPLRRKHMLAPSPPVPLMQIRIQRATRRIQQIDVSILFPFEAHMQPPDFRPYVSMRDEQVSNIAHPTPGPIAQRK